MPFDKISPQQLRLMRLVTAASFTALGVAMAYLGGTGALASGSAPPTSLAWALTASALVYGIFLTNAGLMLFELTTRPPFKVAINVPFVAGNFQTALCVGLVAAGPAAFFMPGVGSAVAQSSVLPLLCVASLVFNLVFVVMTKLHWNFTENTGKELPKG